MLLGLLCFQAIPDKLLLLFNASDSMLEIGIPALRIISLSFIFAGISVITSSVCQAFGFGIYSLLISVGRQLVVLVPAAYLLSKLGRLELVWLSFPVAEIVAMLLSILFIKKALYKVKKNMA
jgi:Na+-driven multidrug efflux pump